MVGGGRRSTLARRHASTRYPSSGVARGVIHDTAGAASFTIRRGAAKDVTVDHDASGRRVAGPVAKGTLVLRTREPHGTTAVSRTACGVQV